MSERNPDSHRGSEKPPGRGGSNSASRVIAVLGPTNTGKTSYACERMLAYRTGIIGLPLRLLAREVFERLIAARGPGQVALLTGEERIMPAKARYWVCTVEAMPPDHTPEFLAVDEIQLCADPERGHVFTDRLLRARGTRETLFLGSWNMHGMIKALQPDIRIQQRPRLSRLTYSGVARLRSMPPRSAIVAFSIEHVHALAEGLKRLKGGAAVVTGALSPRTRNAQVKLYQDGEVDHLVATDAIGMGLNLDVRHVAFAGTRKFDGRRMRALAPNELAQIAGRAGRGLNDGTFGVTGDQQVLPEAVVETIVTHRFVPLQRIKWRNHALDFGSVDGLVASLNLESEHPYLVRAREADDLRALTLLLQRSEVRARTTSSDSLHLLWEACCLPDFRNLGGDDHAELVARIFVDLHDRGCLSTDLVAGEVARVDCCEGDIDTLAGRLARIRTWTYVAQRRGWVADAPGWRERTRAVEDRLSDALHRALAQRFVDRRTSVLMCRLGEREKWVARIDESGVASVDGALVGRIKGFRFVRDGQANGRAAKMIERVALGILLPHFRARAARLAKAPDSHFGITDKGELTWEEAIVGRLVVGDNKLAPCVCGFVDERAEPGVRCQVEKRLQAFVRRNIARHFAPLTALAEADELKGSVRGIVFQLVQALGVLRCSNMVPGLRALDASARAALRRRGVVLGRYTIFLPELLKPEASRLRIVLGSLAAGHSGTITPPAAGQVVVPAVTLQPAGIDLLAGFHSVGRWAIRVDILERLERLLRMADTPAGFEASPGMLSLAGMTRAHFAELMSGLGYRVEKAGCSCEQPVQASDPDNLSGGYRFHRRRHQNRNRGTRKRRKSINSPLGKGSAAGNSGRDRQPSLDYRNPFVAALAPLQQQEKHSSRRIGIKMHQVLEKTPGGA